MNPGKLQWFVKEGEFAGWNVLVRPEAPYATKLGAWFSAQDIAQEFADLMNSKESK